MEREVLLECPWHDESSAEKPLKHPNHPFLESLDRWVGIATHTAYELAAIVLLPSVLIFAASMKSNNPTLEFVSVSLLAAEAAALASLVGLAMLVINTRESEES